MSTPKPSHHDLVDRARRLRQPQTAAEALLWRFLRSGRLAGLKFRRQRPIGPYIADFCCVESKLVVELDGDSHDVRCGYDAARTRWLDQHGYRVLRFMNEDVYRNVQGVVVAIAQACGVAIDI